MLPREGYDHPRIVWSYRHVKQPESDRSPFVTWEKLMGRRLPDYMLDAVVFIYPSKAAADEGEESGATGFIIGMPSKARPEKGHIYIVTNEHVIRHGGKVARLNLAGSRTITFDLSGKWVSHPDGDDVAVAPLENVIREDITSRVLHRGILLSEADFVEHMIGIGDDAYMVGRFLGHEHRETNNPVVQQGKIASRVAHLTNPETGYEQLSILIELRSMSGYSGSLVVLDPPGRVLGINHCHVPISLPVKFEEDDQQKDTEYFVNMPSGMAAVVPAWKIDEVLDLDHFKRQRANEDKELMKAGSR